MDPPTAGGQERPEAGCLGADRGVCSVSVLTVLTELQRRSGVSGDGLTSGPPAVAAPEVRGSRPCRRVRTRSWAGIVSSSDLGVVSPEIGTEDTQMDGRDGGHPDRPNRRDAGRSTASRARRARFTRRATDGTLSEARCPPRRRSGSPLPLGGTVAICDDVADSMARDGGVPGGARGAAVTVRARD